VLSVCIGAQVAAGENVGGSAAEFQGGFNGDGFEVGTAADSVGSEEFWGLVRWVHCEVSQCDLL
jgi:hypothetical protein